MTEYDITSILRLRELQVHEQIVGPVCREFGCFELQPAPEGGLQISTQTTMIFCVLTAGQESVYLAIHEVTEFRRRGDEPQGFPNALPPTRRLPALSPQGDSLF